MQFVSRITQFGMYGSNCRDLGMARRRSFRADVRSRCFLNSHLSNKPSNRAEGLPASRSNDAKVVLAFEEISRYALQIRIVKNISGILKIFRYGKTRGAPACK
jgi:hypothetical protein